MHALFEYRSLKNNTISREQNLIYIELDIYFTIYI